MILTSYAFFSRCKNQKCLKPMNESSGPSVFRLWNRDMAAVLNFRHILSGLQDNGKRPARFCRSSTGSSNAYKRKGKPVSSSQADKKIFTPL